MNARLSSDPIATLAADAVAVVLFEVDEGQAPDDAVDAWTGGLLSDLYASGEFKGKTGSATVIHRPGGLKSPRLLLLGGGKRDKLSSSDLRRAAGTAARRLKAYKVKTLAFAPVDGFDADAQAQAIAEGVVLGQFEADAYKTKDRAEGAVENLILACSEGAEGLRRGLAVGEGQNFARSLALEPGNLLTPTVLAEKARAELEPLGLEVEVLDQQHMEELGMGALLGVAQGSVEEPVMIVVRYEPENPSDSDVHLGLVGKAVTFDTGGISIKPAAEMDRMKYDMAGGAAMLGVMKTLAALKPSIPVTAVVPSVENMPGAAAQRPGDVVTTLSGKTVEVLNTDAEGRLILCDALTYANRLGCNRLVDAATLTGSIVVALGHERGGLFANDEEWGKQVQACADATGEKMWTMPLDDEYRKQLESPIADLANIGTRWGGSITAAYFLKEFTEETPWVHLDIAGTAWIDKPEPDAPKGPTGVGVRTLVELALRS